MENFNFGTGAIETPKDEKIATYSDLIGDTAPFDWNKGYDITLLTKDVSPKNQYSSGSCGGNASAYLAHFNSLLNDINSKEKSARWIYAPVAVKGGGSSQQSLMNRLATVGSASEELVSSYRPDGSTDESFMTYTADFDTQDSIDASNFKGLTPIYSNLDFDSIAKGIRDNGGLVLGIYGKNNGTWNSTYPEAPKSSDTGLWCHWVGCFKAVTINGKKYLGIKNSWGNVGDNGWQYLGEEYLPYIFTAWGFTKIGKENFMFNQDLYLGIQNSDVNKLQEFLKSKGYFPNIKTTDYFGNITQQALIKYQKANNIFPQRGFCGIKTRTQINKDMQSKIPSALQSSDRSGKLSTTIKGLLVLLAPVIISLLATRNIIITEDTLLSSFNDIITIIGSLIASYGLLKKVYYNFK